MRTFLYFSNSAVTSGKALSGKDVDLMKAGRMDIVIHMIINAFFISHDVRDDVKVHLVFNGQPDPPRHLEITVQRGNYFSKKDIGNFLKKMLYKYKEGFRTEVFPGCFIEKKSFLKVVDELIDEGKEIFILDKKGENLKEIKIPEESVFILGDHNGLPRKELNRFMSFSRGISVGPKM